MNALITVQSRAFDTMSDLCKLADDPISNDDGDRPDDEIRISDEAAYQFRIEKALCDMDSFTGWLIEECCDQTAFKYQYHGHVDYEIGRDWLKAKRRTTADLQALMYMTPNERVMRACRDEIVKRYSEKHVA